MSKVTVGLFVALICSTLFAGGCAKKELVKGEGDVSATATQPAETPATAKPPVREEVVQDRTVKEAPATVREETTAADQSMVSLENIYFDFDSYVLTANARDILSRNAQAMSKNSSVNVQIAGNCDERGSDEYNLALGEKRAKSAMDYILTLGVPASRLSFISYGKEKPADPGHDEAAWAKNRRDEFTIIIK
jgi:peptidoglycan-associated lipoprotein